MQNETNMRKLGNGRAEFVYKCVIEAKNYEGNISADYKSYVKKLPHLIRTNGLGNALAFIVSKPKNRAHDLIYKQLSRWLESGNNGCAVLRRGNDLLEFVVSQPSQIYRQLTSETLAFLNWVRRLAEGLIEEDKDVCHYQEG